MTKLLFFSIFATTVLLGCATLDTPFDNDFFSQKAAESGRNTLIGKAYSKTGGGDIISTVGEKVHLWPVHPYTTEWWNKRTTGGAFAKNIDQRLYSSTKEVTINGNNTFKFSDVADGEYYVWVQMKRQISSGTEIIFWGNKINLSGGKTTKLVLKEY